MSIWSPLSARVGALCAAAVLALAGCRTSDTGDSSAGSTPPQATSGPGSAKGETHAPQGAGDPEKSASPSVNRTSPAVSDGFESAAASPKESAPSNPFDSLYPRDFSLKPLSADPVTPLEKPAVAHDLKNSAVTDPAYGTRIYRATDASKGEGERMRHEYSRRQAFNADNTRFIAQDGHGHWYLYDAATFKQIKKLSELKGDCEPIWHPSDPKLLHFTVRDGGTTWWTYDVSADKGEVMFDFSGKTPWPQASSFSVKGEGTTSADGRYIALIAARYDEARQTKSIYGVVVLDIVDKRVVGTLDAKNFPVPGAFPDHVSTSPSGRHVVVSWPSGAGGTRAYTRNLKDSFELSTTSEHSDLAYGPRKQDYYVFADYSNEQLAAVDLDSHERVPLRGLYPARGESYALHVSGQAFDKPGWAVISTYGEYKDHNPRVPATEERAEYRKIWLVELKPNGRVLNVAHIRSNPSNANGEDYFLEPQASASRDLSRIIFASNFGGGPIESYVVGLPSWFDR